MTNSHHRQFSNKLKNIKQTHDILTRDWYSFRIVISNDQTEADKRNNVFFPRGGYKINFIKPLKKLKHIHNSTPSQIPNQYVKLLIMV